MVVARCVKMRTDSREGMKGGKDEDSGVPTSLGVERDRFEAEQCDGRLRLATGNRPVRRAVSERGRARLGATVKDARITRTGRVVEYSQMTADEKAT